MATAQAVTLDGSTHWFERLGDFTGSTDAKEMTFVAWFKRAATGGTHYFYEEPGASFEILFLTNDVIRLNAENSVGTLIRQINSTANTDTTNWQCLMISIDMANTNNRHMYLGDTSIFNSQDAYTDDTIDFTVADHGVWAQNNGNNKMNADVSILWYDQGVYTDFSVESNRRIFFSSSGKVPASLNNSTDGAVGGLSQPILFLNGDSTDYGTNLGTGGGLTTRGTLSNATGPEVETNVILRRRREMTGAF
jgi:hypothetical protein